ncbi:MAG: ribose 5-phosphate isomerase B [Actinomycetota bacterium]
MKIVLGSDHAGFRYRGLFERALRDRKHDVTILGATSEDEPFDYTEVSEAVARAVSENRADRGIIVAGSGNGEAIVANKIHGVRASVCNDLYTAEMARRHNDANVLCVGQRACGDAVALKILEIWLATPFDGGRHAARIANIGALEERLKKEYGG